MPRDAYIGIFELGMNHADEIRPLAKMVRPHAAVITIVEAVHIEFFKSVAEIADAKAEILEGLEPGGAAILPRDNQHFARMAARAQALGRRPISSASAPTRQAMCASCPASPARTAISVTADVFGKRIDFAMGLAGRHQAINCPRRACGGARPSAWMSRSAAADLAGAKALKGRGYREEIHLAGRRRHADRRIL